MSEGGRRGGGVSEVDMSKKARGERGEALYICEL